VTKSPLEQTLTTIQAASLDGSNPLNPNPSMLSASSSPIATAAPPSLSVSGSANYTGTAPTIVAPNLSITGADNFNGARVFVDQNFTPSKDRLAIGDSTANSGTVNGIDWNYNSTTGVLSLNNNAAPSAYQEVLRQVTYTNNNSQDPGNARTIRFSLGNLLANPENGHFYQFVEDNGVQWTDAKTAAAGLNYFGLQGYLTTITSATEQQFIDARLQGNGWIGASDEATEGDWKWVTGPENGQSFWSGSVNGSAVNGRYTNWNDGKGGEPNNASTVNDDITTDEDYGHIIGDDRILRADNTNPALGKWNDLANQRPADEYTPKGYIVEHGGLTGDPVLNITGSVTVNLNGNIPYFNNDNRPDLVWRNYEPSSPDFSENAIWVLDYNPTATNNADVLTLNSGQSKIPLAPVFQEDGWDIEGFFDVDKNGVSDIFWRNYQEGDGRNVVWLMKNDGSTGVAFDRVLELTTVPVNANEQWEIKGVQDFDGDGNANMLWRNEKNGENAIWSLNYNSSATTNPLTLDTSKPLSFDPVTEQRSLNWSIEGWADFTGDKVSDILWRNNVTGENLIWKMRAGTSGTQPYFDSLYRIAGVPVNNTDRWEIEGTADFDNDGISDILWHNYNSTGNDIGANIIWGMQAGGDLNPAKFSVVTPAVPYNPPASEWEIESVADFTGDNIPDIVWRDYGSSQGTNVVWQLKLDNGKVALDKLLPIIPVEDLGWEIEGPNPNNEIV
jgi:Lectin C-type domain